MFLLIVVMMSFNLALGFLAALYGGRGPRCWSDVVHVIEFRVVLDLTPCWSKLKRLSARGHRAVPDRRS